MLNTQSQFDHEDEIFINDLEWVPIEGVQLHGLTAIETEPCSEEGEMFGAGIFEPHEEPE